MRRRKFLIGAGSLAAAGAAGLGTGAFSSVTANRNVDLAIASDTDAYLRLNATSEYAYEDDAGQLTFDLTSDNPTTGGGEGLNGTADTVIEDAFEIKNQGTQPVYVWMVSYDHDSAGNKSVEMVAKDKDLTFPDPNLQNKGDPSVTGSGPTYDGGYIRLTAGESVAVDMIFHVGGGADREWEDKTWQFRADEDYPTERSEWTDTSLPTHDDTLVGGS